MSQGILAGAHDIKIHDSQFIDNSQIINNTGLTANNITQNVNNGRISGLKTLLDHSIPEALHDSSARDPPPTCHPGTRCEYIDMITTWGINSGGPKHRLIWVYGPAGVGKSAVAQSCADAFAEKGKLGAAFFFSMPNKRDKPNFLFTTIAYQLAMKDKSCRQVIDAMISDNPTLVTKAIKQQFQHLIVAPLTELKARGEDVGELVIIIDGLDECASDKAQSEIIEIIAESIRDQTTPLLWVIVSRPEAHIQAKLTSPKISPLSLHVHLPVSRSIDLEITKFLTEELKEIQLEHCLPESWPSERQIGTLVNLSAGLFIYAATVIRFIKDKNSSGPDDQLQAVLALAEQSTRQSESYPLSELDLFYMLILQRVPQKVLPIVQKILLVTTFERGPNAAVNANLLGLTEATFRNVCRSLHSVLELYGDDEPKIKIYHASFMQFLLDPKRSRNFCITESDCATVLVGELFDKLSMALTSSSPPEIDFMSITWPRDFELDWLYIYTVKAFYFFCKLIPLPLSKLDHFYTVVMRHLPQGMCQTAQKILLIRMLFFDHAPITANLLDLTEGEFLDACRLLRPVLELRGVNIKLHDLSFTEFLLDPKRSGDFCIGSPHGTVAAVRRVLLDKLSAAHTRSHPEIPINFPLTWPGPMVAQPCINLIAFRVFFRLSSLFPLDHETLIALSKFSFAKLPMDNYHFYEADLAVDEFLQSVLTFQRSHHLLMCFYRFPENSVEKSLAVTQQFSFTLASLNSLMMRIGVDRIFWETAKTGHFYGELEMVDGGSVRILVLKWR